mmetsp:Transcript_7606/g.15857  ORF Transcript_7606/g.15857 Transcript_7606/m.15857 type:complete len:265 (+) Transcript_7606:214-1008(+)
MLPVALGRRDVSTTHCAPRHREAAPGRPILPHEGQSGRLRETSAAKAAAEVHLPRALPSSRGRPRRHELVDGLVAAGAREAPYVPSSGYGGRSVVVGLAHLLIRVAELAGELLLGFELLLQCFCDSVDLHVVAGQLILELGPLLLQDGDAVPGLLKLLCGSLAMELVSQDLALSVPLREARGEKAGIVLLQLLAQHILRVLLHRSVFVQTLQLFFLVRHGQVHPSEEALIQVELLVLAAHEHQRLSLLLFVSRFGHLMLQRHLL